MRKWREVLSISVGVVLFVLFLPATFRMWGWGPGHLAIHLLCTVVVSALLASYPALILYLILLA